MRTLPQIESILLKKANDQIVKDLRTPFSMIEKILTNYNVCDVGKTVSDIRLHTLKHINKDLSQEAMLLHQSNELICKMEELEDMIADAVCEQSNNSYP